MRALRYNAVDGVRLVQKDKPVPGPNEALVRVLRAGVCSTDLEITKGYVPGRARSETLEFSPYSRRPAPSGKAMATRVPCLSAKEK